MEKIKIFECFAGYGTASFALQKLKEENKLDYELIGFSEINKWAIKCFQQNHGGTNYGSITDIKWEEVPDFDLLTGGSPCQDFSTAGLSKGLFNEDGSLTRSGLIFEFIRAIKDKKPKWVMWENVKGVLTKKHKDSFIMFLEEVCKLGYEVDFKLLNTKDYKIPQNRERIFAVFRRIDDGNR